MDGVYKAVVASGRHRPPAGEVPIMASRAVNLEVDQHRPSRKRERASVEKARLDAAASNDPSSISEQ
jgi:hypothetical protein